MYKKQQKQKLTKEKWLAANGFASTGITYLVVGNSYPIKDELKEVGFKFSHLLRWHGGNPLLELPLGCSYYELQYNDFFIWDEDAGTSLMREGAREKIENIFNPMIESHSQYQGEIGDRIHELPVLISNIYMYESAYGYSWVYIFEDEAGNVYSWSTSSLQMIATGMRCRLSGTIKKHATYKSVPTTKLKNCRIKVAEK